MNRFPRSAASAVVLAASGSATTAFAAPELSDSEKAKQGNALKAIDVLEKFSKQKRVNALKLVATCPEAESLENENALVVEGFDGHKSSFHDAVERARNDRELHERGIAESVMGILSTLDENFDDFEVGLHRAVVLERVGEHVVRVENKATSPIVSRQVIFVDATALRHMVAESESMEMALDVLKGGQNVAWMGYAIAFLSLLPPLITAWRK